MAGFTPPVLVTPEEASRISGRSVDALAMRARRGRLRSVQVTSPGLRRYFADDIEALARDPRWRRKVS